MKIKAIKGKRAAKLKAPPVISTWDGSCSVCPTGSKHGGKDVPLVRIEHPEAKNADGVPTWLGLCHRCAALVGAAVAP